MLGIWDHADELKGNPRPECDHAVCGELFCGNSDFEFGPLSSRTRAALPVPVSGGKFLCWSISCLYQRRATSENRFSCGKHRLTTMGWISRIVLALERVNWRQIEGIEVISLSRASITSLTSGESRSCPLFDHGAELPAIWELDTQIGRSNERIACRESSRTQAST